MLYLPAEFPQNPDIVYLNHAAVAPWPKRAAEAVQRFAFENMTDGATHYPDWMKTLHSLRERLAWLIGADSSDDIALVKNTSEGLSLVAHGLDWQHGDHIVGIRHEFPSNQVVWESLQQYGVDYDTVDVNAVADPEQALLDACRPNTRLLAVSSVHFATGLRLDLGRLSTACRERDILLCVDGIQSIGALPFDLKKTPVDFLTADGHKWMLGPEGLGFFYCRPDLRERLKLHQYGWAMREHPGNYDSPQWQVAQSARRFEAGSPNMLGAVALDASLDLLQELGFTAIGERLRANVEFLMVELARIPGIELVSPQQSERRSGIVSFRHAEKPAAKLYELLMKHRVVCANRGGNVRFSPHFYTQEDRISKAVKLLRQIIQFG